MKEFRTKLFFVGIMPILYMKFKKTSLDCTHEQANKVLRKTGSGKQELYDSVRASPAVALK
jgi:hypothetical protein